VFVVLIIAAIIGVMALAVDVGYLYVCRAGLQATAEASALAGASALGSADSVIRQRAVEYAGKNRVNCAPVPLQDEDIDLGHWDSRTRAYTSKLANPALTTNAVKVTPILSSDRSNAVNLFFAPIVNIRSANVGASAVATRGVRDVAVVLDYSGSMNDDSSLCSSASSTQNSKSPALARLGNSTVEQTIKRIWQGLGSPQYGTMTFDGITIQGGVNTIRQRLGLDNVPYPYPMHTGAGSPGKWDEYIKFVTHYDRNDPQLSKYYYKFGYVTLIDYWESEWAKYAQTPDLWKADEEPVTSVKDGVSVFIAFMLLEQTDDRMALVSYTYTDGGANLEVGLTNDYNQVENRSRHMQAAHYHNNTNIAAGLHAARMELLNNGRPNATKLIVLLTDGVANWRAGGSEGYSVTEATGTADMKAEAGLAAADHLPIVTIGLGTQVKEADLKYVANTTGGLYFNVPGGKNVNDYRTQLFQVFAQIAAYRPLMLVN
jgi:hypothetical protein